MEPVVSVNVHFQSKDVGFAPDVVDFDSNGEVIKLGLSWYVSVFLTKERLHQLKDVLVEACGRYPKT